MTSVYYRVSDDLRYKVTPSRIVREVRRGRDWVAEDSVSIFEFLNGKEGWVWTSRRS